MRARALALACLALFLGRTFHKGWTTNESDFPNYYTAAVLMRHGEPLHKYYDWAWFQRQMNFAGIEEPLGTYVPQTPLTMLPLVPLAGLPVQRAKQVWLSVNLVLLAATVWLLGQITKFRFEHIALLLFAGYGTLQSNFYLGQYYVFLLFLVTLAFYCLERRQDALGGGVLGVVFALKLYGAPFALYFVAKRNWKALAGMVAVMVAAAGLAIAIFHWSEVRYFADQVFPRAVDGEGSADPFHTNNGTLLTLLRRTLVPEAELNPKPLWSAPWLFFFLRPFVTLAILGVAAVGVGLKGTECDRRGFAWFMIAALCVAPNLGSYAFILFLLPILLLMEQANTTERVFLVVAYVLLGFPLRLEWTGLFPKLWIGLALFLIGGRDYWRLLTPRTAIVVLGCVAAVATVDARRHILSYRNEPSQHFERIPIEKGVVLTPSVAVSKDGIFAQVIGRDRYLLSWLHDGRAEALSFPGEVFHPVATSVDGPIDFELVTHGTSQVMQVDPKTGTTTLASRPELPWAVGPVTSPDGEWVAFETAATEGSTQIKLRRVSTGTETTLTGGRCDSAAPAWEPDSRSLLFTSDCGRAFGLPALYRARVPQ
jgi:hypothetical protein